MSKELEKQVALLTDAELVKWASLFAKMASLHAEIASLHAEFQGIAEVLHVSSPTALREAFKAELKRRTIAKSSG